MAGFTSLTRPLLAMVFLAGLSAAQVANHPDPPCGYPAQCRSLHVAQVVFGIINYARWAQPPATLKICIVGATQYADQLWQTPPSDSLYPIQTLRLLIDNPLLTEECQVIYLGASDGKQSQQLFQRVANRPILIITESDQGCSEGSQFCLKITDERVGFEINLDAIARSGVRIHPNVLQLGKRAGEQA